MLKRLTLMIVATLLLSACGNEPTLDTTSEQALESSYEAMKAALPSDRADRLQNAMQSIFSSAVMDNMAADDFNPEQRIQATYKDLHGKTADEIIAMAEQ